MVSDIDNEEKKGTILLLTDLDMDWCGGGLGENGLWIELSEGGGGVDIFVADGNNWFINVDTS